MHRTESSRERAIAFAIGGDELIGIFHDADVTSDVGVLVVVGGPQYRVGSHRQFVLLARSLAAGGIPTMRFDFRGTGDSSGDPLGFELVTDDIQAAIEHLGEISNVRRVVIWGLCDGASAALMYASQDPRVVGLVLLNPWVHSAPIEARVRFTTYYRRRLASAAFWRKAFRLELDLGGSLRSLGSYLRGLTPGLNPSARAAAPGFVERMRAGWASFRGRILVILSGDDLTAGEFEQLCASDRRWRALIAGQNVKVHRIADANHTFASNHWRHEVEQVTLSWIRTVMQARHE